SRSSRGTSWPSNWWRRPNCGAAWSARSNPSGPKNLPATSSNATTANHTGNVDAAPSWPTNGSPCTGCRSSRNARSPTAGSTRNCPGNCSSAAPWSKATGRPATTSSTTTGNSSTRSRTWSTGPAAEEALATRGRSRGRRVVDETVRHVYAARVPERVVRAAPCDRWGRKARRTDPELLDLTREDRINDGVDTVSEDQYTNAWRQDEFAFPLTYQFEPGSDSDGVTAHIPVKYLNQVDNTGFDWQIPDLRDALVTALIRSLPKPLRRNFVPVPDNAAHARGGLDPEDGSLPEALAAELTRMSGER